MDCSTPGFSVPCHFMSIESVMPCNHLLLCRPLLLLPSIFPRIRVFSSESAVGISWLKYWSLSFSISPSNEYSGLISFRIDWFDILAVQGILKSPPAPQFESINSLAFSLYGPTLASVDDYWKTIALTIGTFVSKVMSMLFNMLTRFVIAFLPRSKCLFISWLQLPSTVILELKKVKSFTVSIVSPSICHKVMELDAMMSLSQLFHSPFSLSSRRSLVHLCFLP